MNFSQRVGLEPAKQLFQTNSMNDELRVGLWNAFHTGFGTYIEHERQSYHGTDETRSSAYSGIFKRLWVLLFKHPVDSLPLRTGDTMQIIRNWFLQASTPWNKVYEFIEFFSTDRDLPNPEQFREICNGVLTREWSGYRFVGEHLAPLTDPVEIKAIEDAAGRDETVLKPVTTHVKEAVRLLADKTNPDYRHSIKESISAVEAMCRIVAQKPDTTLTPALDAIKNKMGLHKHLYEALKNLYWYTSDAHGIRHALKDDATPEAEDAKFMLVTCAAFVNYMAEKAAKANLLPK